MSPLRLVMAICMLAFVPNTSWATDVHPLVSGHLRYTDMITGSVTIGVGNDQVQLIGMSKILQHGALGLLARSEDGRYRMYGHSSPDGSVRADLFSPFGKWKVTNIVGVQKWEPDIDDTAVRGPIDLEPRRSALSRRKALTAPAPTATPDSNGHYEVRVLVLYTQLLLQRMASKTAVELEGGRLIHLANSYMETNQVPVRFTLADTREFQAADEAQTFYQSQDAMVGSSFVKRVRDDSHSDLVVLLRADIGGSLCGLSSGFNGMLQGDPPTDIDPEVDAFNVVAVAGLPGQVAACRDDTFIHELGHSLGAGHEYLSSGGNVYWKPYSHALPCPSLANGVSVFSLMWGTNIGPLGMRGDQITRSGSACGAGGIEGIEATQADNVRVMSEAAPYVAEYRNSPTSSRANSTTAFGGSLSASMLLAVLAAAFARKINRGTSKTHRR